ncbi:MAG: hypothetical protein IH936_09360 [Acidobacteria bacterium]|nr:hypothetical protein [Acidobacteriota bacterium]
MNEEHKLVRMIVTMGHSVRDKANIKVRQPLSLVQVALPTNLNKKVILDQKDVICEELNVKDLEILKDAQELIVQIVKPNARVLGPKYGKEVQEIIKLAKSGNFEVSEDGTVKIGDYVLSGDEVEVGFEGKEGYDVASKDGVSVVLDTTITEDLKHEGYARDIVRSIQDLRKDAGYNVDDRIYIFIQAEEAVGKGPAPPLSERLGSPDRSQATSKGYGPGAGPGTSWCRNPP